MDKKDEFLKFLEETNKNNDDTKIEIFPRELSTYSYNSLEPEEQEYFYGIK